MSTDSVEWRAIAFDRLSPLDLHDVLKLRQDVFIVEQNCVFGEIDGRDPLALHLLGRRADTLVAYARIFRPEVLGPWASIGRVVTAPSARGSGLGRALMHESMRIVGLMAPEADVRLAAQAHLEAFYASLGFRPVGEMYFEDGIAHLDMVRPARAGSV